MKKFIEKLKLKLIKLVEYIHLKFFGHEMSDTMRKFLQNLSWSFFGGIIAGGILFGVNIFAGRILGPEEYGRYGLVVAIAMVFIIPMVMGIDTATVHYVAKNKNETDKKKYISAAISFFPLFSLASLGGLFLFNNHLARFFATDVYVINIGIIFAFFLAIRSLMDALTRGLQLFKFQSGARIVETATILVAFCLAVFFMKTLVFTSYLGIILLGYIFFIAVVFIRLRTYFSISFMHRKKIMSYSFYVIFGSITGVLLNSFDKILINKYIGAEQLGIYNAYSVASVIIVSQLMVIFINVFFSTLSSISNKKNILNKINKIAKLAFLPLFLFLSVVTTVVILLFGKEYSLDILLVMKFGLLSTITSYFTVLWWLIVSQGRSGVRFTAIHGLIAGLIFICLTLLFRDDLTIHQVVIFLLVGLFYAIIIGNLKGLK